MSIDANNCRVYPVSEEDLPPELPKESIGSLEFLSGASDKNSGKLLPEDPPEVNKDHELTFYRKEIPEIIRHNKNSSASPSEGTSSSSRVLVYSCYTRFVYEISISLYNKPKKLYVSG